MNLTHNFKLDEFKVSAGRPDLAKKIVFTEMDVYKLRLISIMHLEPVRAEVNGPVRILSGKRSPELNSAVGGSPTSQHMVSEAVDFTCPDLRKAYDFLRKNTQSFGQMIIYLTGSRKLRFIHISLPTERKQGQVLYHINGKYLHNMP